MKVIYNKKIINELTNKYKEKGILFYYRIQELFKNNKLFFDFNDNFLILNYASFCFLDIYIFLDILNYSIKIGFLIFYNNYLSLNKTSKFINKNNIFYDYEKSIWCINDNYKNKLYQLFPDVNIEKELKNMQIWLECNKNRPKKNFEKFINNWLKKSQNKIKYNLKLISKSKVYNEYDNYIK